MEQEADADRPNALIGAADNVLRLLRLFEDHEMIRVNQVAREMGLSRSTVHRMLTTLSHHQFVEQDCDSRAYRPGPALVDIGLSVVAKIDIRALAHTSLVELRDVTGETAHLGIMRGATSVLFLDCVESGRVVRAGSRTGVVLPAHSTCTGKALLAELTDAEVAALYPSGPLEATTPRALTTLDALLAELAEVRRLGYAVNRGESEPEIAGVATTVRDQRGRVRCALLVTAPLSRVDDAWVKASAAETTRIAHELGERLC